MTLSPQLVESLRQLFAASVNGGEAALIAWYAAIDEHAPTLFAALLAADEEIAALKRDLADVHARSKAAHEAFAGKQSECERLTAERDEAQRIGGAYARQLAEADARHAREAEESAMKIKVLDKKLTKQSALILALSERYRDKIAAADILKKEAQLMACVPNGMSTIQFLTSRLEISGGEDHRMAILINPHAKKTG